MTTSQYRITRLVGLHAVLAAAPLAVALVPFNTATLPLMWAAYALPIGGLMTLAFWTGIGNSRLVWRIAGLLAGCGYLAFWPTISGRFLSPDEWAISTAYLQAVIPYLVIGILIGGMFSVMRRWFQIRQLAGDELVDKPNRVQFSVLHILVLTSFVAVVLSLMRGARGTEPSDDGVLSWQWWAANGLGIVTFFANTACAAFAALGPSAVMRNCLLVLIASVLLGVAIAFSARQDQVSGWLFAGGVLTMVLPTIEVLASLLWLRGSGLRLISRKE